MWCEVRMEMFDTTDHCLHECMHEGEPSQVCCWCGDLFLSRWDTKEHGEYAPATIGELPRS